MTSLAWEVSGSFDDRVSTWSEFNSHLFFTVVPLSFLLGFLYGNLVLFVREVFLSY